MGFLDLLTKKAPTIDELRSQLATAQAEVERRKRAYAEDPTAPRWKLVEDATTEVEKILPVLRLADEREAIAAEKGAAEERARQEARLAALVADLEGFEGRMQPAVTKAIALRIELENLLQGVDDACTAARSTHDEAERLASTLGVDVKVPSVPRVASARGIIGRAQWKATRDRTLPRVTEHHQAFKDALLDVLVGRP